MREILKNLIISLINGILWVLFLLITIPDSRDYSFILFSFIIAFLISLFSLYLSKSFWREKEIKGDKSEQ